LGSYTSLSHGWAAAPTTYLTGDVLGVTPTSGGFSTFSVLPHTAGGPTWAEGTVPTPHGDITVAWHATGDTFTEGVTAPAQTTATVGVATAGVTQVSLDGQVVWSDGAARDPRRSGADGYIQVGGVTGSATLTAQVSR